MLRADGLRVDEHSAPKQTETTQRWKIAVRADGIAEPVRTKFEFSHRDLDPRFSLDPVPEAVVAGYALRPPRIQHYLAEAAVEQKVQALAGRSETQARDIFDLELLFRRTRTQEINLAETILTSARDRAIELPFDAYRDQVLPFLDPEAAAMVDRPDDWERTQTYVAERLEAIGGCY